MTKMKQKTRAIVHACQSREQTIDAIRELGDARRELLRIETEINDALAAATARRQDKIDALKQRIEGLTEGIATWCAANRAALCPGGVKTANLVTGEVSWRIRPPSVSIRSAEKVLAKLKALGLQRLIRTAEAPNKEAMLADPRAVDGIAGISIVTGVEDFAIAPFEIDVREA